MFDPLYNLIGNLANGWQIFLFIVFLVGGLAALVKGADLFVGGASGIASKLGVSALIIGLTVVSIGTSLPEASVSVVSAIHGSADISLGNVVGSNIFNILVVIGCAALFSPIVINRAAVKRDMPVMLGSAVLLLIFAIWFSSNAAHQINRIESAVMLASFVGYLGYTIFTEVRRGKASMLSPSAAQGECAATVTSESATAAMPSVVGKKVWLLVIMLASGLALIVLGGEFVTYGAKNIALKLGMSEALVALTIVAIGTSLPELVTSVVASRKGENDIALGNAIGSCIFNIILILGLAGVIVPLNVSVNVIIDIAIMLAIFVALLIYSLLRKTVTRAPAIVMLSLYAAYLAYIILRDFVFA